MYPRELSQPGRPPFQGSLDAPCDDTAGQGPTVHHQALLPSGRPAPDELPCRGPLPRGLPAAGEAFLDALLGLGLLDDRDVAAFLQARADRLSELAGLEPLGQALLQAGLLTRYQLDRVRCGAAGRLLLGPYRVLEELGKGGMGVVYRAEHRLLRRAVAVKVLPLEDDCPPSVRQRFHAEIRVLAALSHPNIVAALDAGELPPEAGEAGLLYLVLELVDGGDLDRYVQRHGPCGVAEACHYARQAAYGLQAAHDRHLVHRDLKPSNLLRTSGGEVKLVDSGLARNFCSRLTDPRVLLGSVEFMAPEQSHDPSGVGKEADVYGLGATLFYLLTGEAPYPFHAHLGAAVRALQRDEPRRLRQLRPDVPAALDELLAWLLDRDPSRRPTSPLAVFDALAPFLHSGEKEAKGRGDSETGSEPSSVSVSAGLPPRRALVVEQLRQSNQELQRSLEARTADLREAHNALLFGLAKMAESRDGETPGHLRRMRDYCLVLARQAALAPPWAGLVNERFLEQLARCVPLHDIGKIGLPDDVLLKPGALNAQERALVETHPLIGDRILEALGREHGTALEFLGMARGIVRHHHERFDGRGYPDRLAGEAIPAAARLVAVADVYDALRRERLYKRAFEHASAVATIQERSEGQFDPSLLEALALCHSQFERIYRENTD
jgi:HD-GYP domain-containing protein (c-di-GMP phosphodiesterase class II)